MIVDAIDAIRRGWHIFPATAMGKRPHPAIEHWGKSATNNITVAVTWWQQWPQANIAVACKPSGLLVIDCDPPKNEGDPDGIDEYTAAWTKNGDTSEMFDTRIVTTGSGGLHFYYLWPPGMQSQGAKLPGTKNVDIRCNNGTDGNYVLGAGSVTDKGPYRVENDRPPAPCPGWLGQLVSQGPPAHRTQPAEAARERRAAPEEIGGLLTWLAAQQPGGQDNALQWAARCCRDAGLARDQAGRELWDVIRAWPTSGAPWTERDIERHLRQAY